jgi:hypothetical protein
MPDAPEMPERLWKYREWNEYARRLIVHGELYYAKTDELNDPFEFRWREDYPKCNTEIDAFVREMLALNYPNDSIAERTVHYHDMFREAKEYAERVRRGGPLMTSTKIMHGLFCASEVNNDILMWSHYAGKHTGVCVGFRLNAVKPKILLPVNYTDELPIISVWTYAKCDGQVMVDLSCTKAKHWSYEKEWRTIHNPGVRTIPSFVDTVIIGALAPETAKRDVIKAVAEAPQNIRVLQARLSETHYAVEFDELKFAGRQSA